MPRLWLIGQGVGPCPACSVYGFDRTGPAVVYLVTHPVLRAHKVGIAGVASSRLRQHRAAGWEVYRTIEFPTGAEALAVEQAVLHWMRDEEGWPPALSAGSGWTETVDGDEVTAAAIWWQVLKERRRLVEIRTSGSNW